MDVGPVEKKPFYHFSPGMRILSVGGLGCNMACKFCQNFMISQETPCFFMEWDEELIVRQADQAGACGIAFCFNEPVVSMEKVVSTAILAKRSGFKTLLKTNGYVNSDKFVELCEVFDAINVDVKGNASFYRSVCGVDLPDDPHDWVIMKNIGLANSMSMCHLEISMMVTSGKVGDILPLVECASDILFYRDVPIHLVRLIPDYLMGHSRSPSKQEIENVYVMVKEYFDFVYVPYIGNEISFCPDCGSRVVVRSGIQVLNNRLSDGSCPDCGGSLNFHVETTIESD